MATLTLTVPNGVANRCLDAVCSLNGYRAIINGQPNPQTKSQFVVEWLGKQVKEQVRLYEVYTATVAATQAAEADINTNIIIT